jgi:hypothetical protein
LNNVRGEKEAARKVFENKGCTKTEWNASGSNKGA